MTCQDCQRHLLASDDATCQSLEVGGHLAECRVCQDWLRRLQRLESNVALILVPSSRAGDKLGRMFRNPAPSAKPPMVLPAQRSRWRLAINIASGMAAAVLLTFLGTYLGNWLARAPHKDEPLSQTQAPQENLAASPKLVDKPQPVERPAPEIKQPPAPAKALAALVLEFDLRLARTSDPKERVAILADLADVLQSESTSLVRAGGAKELVVMARLYEKVLKDGVVARARDLPMAERRAALDPIAQQLAQTRSAAEKMADAAEPALAAPLRQIAAAAQHGDGVLREMMSEATP